MLNIKKTGEGYYLATLGTGTSVLKRVDCTRLKYALSDVIKAHREISIDIKGIRSIEQDAYRILKEINQLAETKRCRIRFINMDPQVAPAIKKLQERKIQFHDELEQL